MFKFQLVDVYDNDVLGEYYTKSSAIMAMQKVFDNVYPPNDETVDYEGCYWNDGYATDSSGERWLEIREIK